MILHRAWKPISALFEKIRDTKVFVVGGRLPSADIKQLLACFLHYKGETGLSSQVHIGGGVSGCNTRKIYTSQPPPPSSSPSRGEDVTWPPPVVSDCSRSRILTEISLLLYVVCLTIYFYLILHKFRANFSADYSDTNRRKVSVYRS
jgi:hypothetical protein